jgi:hypothetical protein
MNHNDLISVGARRIKAVLLNLDERLVSDLSRLLKTAMPSREKRFRLDKLLQTEVEGASYSERILQYYSIPFEHRTRNQFRKVFGIDAYPWLHQQFLLDFASAEISDTELSRIASNIRFYLRNELPLPKEIVEADLLHLVLYKMVSPGTVEGAERVGVASFLRTWRRVCFLKWGDRYEEVFGLFENELFDLSNRSFEYQSSGTAIGLDKDDQGFSMDLSQTDLDWMKALLLALDCSADLPAYPLSRGPDRPVTRQIEKLSRSYNFRRKRPMAPVLEYAVRFLCEKVLTAYGQQEAA